MIEYLNQLDASVLLFFNGMHSTFFDKFMMLCTGKFIWIPMYATILFILFKSFKPKLVLVYAIALGVAIALTDQTCASIIRPVVERLRPSNPGNPLSEYVHLVNGYRGGSYGFMSCRQLICTCRIHRVSCTQMATCHIYFRLGYTQLIFTPLSGRALSRRPVCRSTCRLVLRLYMLSLRAAV